MNEEKFHNGQIIRLIKNSDEAGQINAGIGSMARVYGYEYCSDSRKYVSVRWIDGPNRQMDGGYYEDWFEAVQPDDPVDKLMMKMGYEL